MLDLHTFLKLREAGDPVFERDDFTICDERISPLPMKGRRHLRVSLVQPNAVPREEVQFVAAAKSQAALAIPLRFKQPSLSRKALVRECRQHGRNPSWLGPLAKPGFDFSRQSVQRIAAPQGTPSPAL